MFSRYRLSYLAVVAAAIGAAVAATAVDTPGAGTAPADVLTETSTPEGYEKGNLSEVGAREVMTITDYERAVKISKGKPVLLFKHSTECEVSGAAYRRVAAWAEEKGKKAPALFLVKVIERRPVPQEIAARSGVTHESPQAILFVGEQPVWNASHEAITGEAIEAAIQSASKPD